MHIILTHEQADFDALAALFGAACVCSSLAKSLPEVGLVLVGVVIAALATGVLQSQ